MGTKRDLVERLIRRVVSEAKEKGRVANSSQKRNAWEENMADKGNFKKRAVAGEESAGAQEWVIPDSQYLALERSLERTIRYGRKSCKGN